ncbi:hypothetical protein [Homoserinibacter sp. GY 40078]|uniref:hypothetical protein n=1 Tax=Homoserinibacter sp. GY 40078 TaxID=2603275 RepID=UPI0011CA5066|nr:hypothetical protein [Homoserinibacter sp. GY 40078]TXK18543.1 hypothetical protein FVQ89_00875 [Homoserinibacter sp. GY 40078]
MTAIDTPSTPKRTGRKRAVLAAGALLGVGGLLTAATWMDYGLLNLNGSGGFGGSETAFDLAFSSGQENTIADVANWSDANPTAEDIVPLAGADALVPGGAPVYVRIPVKNASEKLDADAAWITLENATAADSDPAQKAKNDAYAKLIRFSVAETDDALAAGGLSYGSDLSFSGTKTSKHNLTPLAAGEGNVIVVKVWLDAGATQADADAANGGGVSVQARIDGQTV